MHRTPALLTFLGFCIAFSLPSFAHPPVESTGGAPRPAGSSRRTVQAVEVYVHHRRGRPSPQESGGRLTQRGQFDRRTYHPQGSHGKPLLARWARRQPPHSTHGAHYTNRGSHSEGEHPSLPQFNSKRSPGILGATMTPAKHALRHQFAAIDRLRDQAIERGDLRLLHHADKLERQLRMRSSQVPESPTRPHHSVADGVQSQRRTLLGRPTPQN